MSACEHRRSNFEPRIAYRRSLRTAVPLYLGLVMAVACSDDSAPPSASSLATISITGLQSEYAAGEKVAVAANAVSKDLRPVANLPVMFVPSASGIADPATAITDANGVATTTWTMPGTTGTTTLRASSGTKTFQVTTDVRAALAARINKLAGDAQDGIEGELLPGVVRVSVTDVFGNAVVGRAVTFMVTSGGGSVTVSSATTAADGSASTEWRVGPGGAPNTLEVRTSDLSPTTFTASSRIPAGTFALTGSMETERYGHTATLLRDGRVLIAGGTGQANRGMELATAELYDPATGKFSPTTTFMHDFRSGHSATLLADGRVLIAGGIQANRGVLSGADLFDPATNRFVETGKLLDAQTGHDGTLLRSGEVLITGGGTRAELYNPATGQFRYTGAYADTSRATDSFARAYIGATLLRNGTVLIAFQPRAEVYDPLTGTFATTGSMLTQTGANFIYGRTATLLMNGDVLLTGGKQIEAGIYSQAELYDPATGVFRYTASLPFPRYNHTATRLASGNVLIAGGDAKFNCNSSGCDELSISGAEVYDINGVAWVAAGPMKVRRSGQRATLLLDGRVLITGGLTVNDLLNGPDSYPILNSAELFTERPGTTAARKLKEQH